MPITNPKKFGLGVQNKLGDLRNPATALKALGISGNDLTGITRAVRNTTRAAHSDGATVTNTTDYVGWGEAASGDKVFDPGTWTLDNYGSKLIALITDSACFEWDSSLSNANEYFSGSIQHAKSLESFTGKSDKNLLVYGNNDIKRIQVYGLGKKSKITTDSLRALGAKISSISTSPERDDTILVENPFAN